MSRWFRPVPQRDKIASLYGAIVAQARAPAFYSLYGVPDTVAGRLEMLMLHVFLVLRQLHDESGTALQLGQGIFDHFCQDMDDSMREMGVGDLAVPRKMRRIGQAFYERQAAYERALAQTQNNGLAAVIRRNLSAWQEEDIGPEYLATYIRKATGQLARQRTSEQNELTFPDPGQLFLIQQGSLRARRDVEI
jgi:cytochrome b pre-mRNA-processing protein 3